MRRANLRKWALWGGAVMVLAGAAFLLTLPPAPRGLQGGTFAGASLPPVARGAYHVHSTRSDGSGTVDEIAAAAARAGLQFVIFTDHGDGTRAPMAPAYRHGVLCVDAVEISTDHGHYVALGLPRAPYRLAGAAGDVMDDVVRLGGFGVAAHPDSPKASLAWRAWDRPVPALEWINLDTEWRDESSLGLLGRLAQHAVRPAGAVAAIVSRAEANQNLARVDTLARTRRIVVLPAVDAHARLDADEMLGGPFGRMAVPGYETSFRTLRLNLELPASLTGRAEPDEAALLHAIRQGRAYSSLDAWAAPARLDFAAESAGATARMGEFLVPAGGLRLWAAADAPAGAILRVLCDGRAVGEGPANRRLSLSVAAPGHGAPASCRLEVGWPEHGGFARWVVTNPIYFRAGDPPPAAVPPIVLVESDTLGDRTRGAGWSIEHDAGTKAEHAAQGAGLLQQVTLRYRLQGGTRAGQYAALVTPDVEALARLPVLAFTARADRPMRVSVQVRERPANGRARRWRRSIYLDAAPADFVLPLAGFDAVPPDTGPPPSSGLQGLLFVVDTENSAPGASGTVTIERLRAGAVTPRPGA